MEKVDREEERRRELEEKEKVRKEEERERERREDGKRESRSISIFIFLDKRFSIFSLLLIPKRLFDSLIQIQPFFCSTLSFLSPSFVCMTQF